MEKLVVAPAVAALAFAALLGSADSAAPPRPLFRVATAPPSASPGNFRSAFSSIVTAPDGRTTATIGSSGSPAVLAPAPSPLTIPDSFVRTPAVAPAPPTPVAVGPVIPVLRRSEVHDESGQFALAFETGNGISVEEQGGLKRNEDGEWKDDVVLVKRGSYSYTGPDGRLYKLSYTADENGFHPSADYLPIAP